MNFYQDIFFSSLDKLRGRNTIKRLKFLRKSQFWEESRLKEWQLDKLNKLLFEAKSHSPYYSRLFKNTTLPLKSLNEISDLPIMTKKVMRDNFEEIKCANISNKELELSKTGGSTGEPSYYYLSNNSKDWNRGTVYRSAEWADVFLGERTVQMMGSHYDQKEFQKLKWKLIFFFQRYKDLSVARVNDEILDSYFHQIKNYRPTSIWGYASGIYLMADFISKNYPKSNFNFLKALITSSETLQPSWREKINSVFGEGKVFDHYGSREVYIASECKMHNGYHIHSEVILLEVVDKNNMPLPPGEIGRILITDLSNYVFPFIRYEIGDIGVLGDRKKCECGVCLPMLERVEGRIPDIVILKDRILTPPNFTILMSDFQGVDSYQIIQEEVDYLVVKIVSNDRMNNDVKNYIKASLAELTGVSTKIDIQYVDDIPVPASGKRRYIISKVAAERL
jgi:phenylacetate-CoA ligase